LALTSCAAADQPPVTIESVSKAWKDRQESVERAWFEFTLTQTYHKGATDYLASLSRGKVTDIPNPPQDYFVKGKGKVTFDGAKLRYYFDHDQWDPQARALYPEHVEEAFDGEFTKYLIRPTSSSKPYGGAEIRPAKKSKFGSQLSLLPLLSLGRGDPAGFVGDLGGYRLSPGVFPVATRPCVELVKTSRVKNQRQVLYLDSERGFALVRRMTIENEKPTWQLDVVYSDDPIVGWVPKSWEYFVRSNDGKVVVDSGSRVVTAYKINPKLGPEEFDFRLPPGTAVRDSTSGKAVESVIQDDGEKGGEVPGARGLSYEELKNAPRRTSNRMAAWVIVGATLVGLGIACFLVRGIHRYRGRRNRPEVHTQA
jgi:hypothetical protein